MASAVRIWFVRRLLAGFLLTVSGCAVLGAEDSSDTEGVILFENLEAVDLKTDPATINAANLDGHVLTLTIQHPGGCEEHEYGLFGWTGWEPSSPPAGRLYLSHDGHGDHCEALITEELSFDIRPLKAAWKDRFQHRGRVKIEIFSPGEEEATAVVMTTI